MQRTIAIVFASGLATSSAFGSIAVMGGGAGTLQAGVEQQLFALPVPSNVNVQVQDPGQSSSATIIGSGSSAASWFNLDVDFAGQGAQGAASMTFSTEITLDNLADFVINGTLSGLTGYDLLFRPVDHSYQVHEYLDRDELGFFGTLVDDFENPVPNFNVQGVLIAGTYELSVTILTSSIDGQSFDGAGGFSVSFTGVPAPASLVAMLAPSLLIARRRRA